VILTLGVDFYFWKFHNWFFLFDPPSDEELVGELREIPKKILCPSIEYIGI
jgi:hypothetical protein